MKNIMIADDTAFMRLMLRNIVEGMGLRVVAEAGNGAEAIKQYNLYHPDLVLMDITMPEMDGLEATKKIMDAHNSAKIIICSAVGNHEMVIRAITAGARDFVVKPFLRDRVETSIRLALNLASA